MSDPAWLGLQEARLAGCSFFIFPSKGAYFVQKIPNGCYWKNRKPSTSTSIVTGIMRLHKFNIFTKSELNKTRMLL